MWKYERLTAWRQTRLGTREAFCASHEPEHNSFDKNEDNKQPPNRNSRGA